MSLSIDRSLDRLTAAPHPRSTQPSCAREADRNRKPFIAGRIQLLPPFRRTLASVPFGLDHPIWIEDREFDLYFHVRHIAVPPPGDRRQLAELVARIHARPLDRFRPLWELYLIEGLEDGRVAVFTKLHHGVCGAEIPPVDDWRPFEAPRWFPGGDRSH